jgi:hypothetical protein
MKLRSKLKIFFGVKNKEIDRKDSDIVRHGDVIEDLVYQLTSMANQMFFLPFMDIEFGIEILVYMYVLYVSAYGVFVKFVEQKNYGGFYVDMEAWFQCHNIYGTCSPILNTHFLGRS